MTLAYRLEPAPDYDLKCYPFRFSKNSATSIAHDIELMADGLEVGGKLAVNISLVEVTWDMCEDCMAEDCPFSVASADNGFTGGRE